VKKIKLTRIDGKGFLDVLVSDVLGITLAENTTTKTTYSKILIKSNSTGTFMLAAKESIDEIQNLMGIKRVRRS